MWKAATFGPANTEANFRYNRFVPNRAYLSVWCRDFSESTMLAHFESLLATVPFSKTRPGFTELIIRAVSYGEPPVVEHDLRQPPLTAAEIAAAAGEILHSDIAYEVEAHWDLWSPSGERKVWTLGPQRLEILCQGPDYDDGASLERGHILIDVGFEDLFTGDSHLPNAATGKQPEEADDVDAPPSEAAEREFMQYLAQPGKLREYQQQAKEKTVDNINRLQEWMRRILTDVPVERVKLWSEGEENFEDRIDAIQTAG